MVSYSTSPTLREDTVTADWTIGTLDGGGPDTFGAIRAIDVGRDGSIYVLDSHASEVQVFSSDGAHQKTIGARGQGPGEISGANGLTLAPDGRIWISDTGARALIVFSPDGREVARHPSFASGAGLDGWYGSIDHSGVVWQQALDPIGEYRPPVRYTGPEEVALRFSYKWFDPAAVAYDSVLLHTTTLRAYRATSAGRSSVMLVPFLPWPLAAVDSERNIWKAVSDEYVLTRLNTSGDTTLVLRIEHKAPALSQEDIDAWAAESAGRLQGEPSLRRGVDALIPDRKPILASLLVDDESRLWVGRVVPAGEAPLYDVFTRDGEYLGSPRLFRNTLPFVTPVVRNGHVYAVILGQFGEQYVAVGRLPQFQTDQ